jgi:2-polyprenyl-6-hydroxyphenyl methylase/3-demethylubiquinone-9 3-methyltransferase
MADQDAMGPQTTVAVDAAPAARTTPESWDWHWRRIRLPQRPRWFNPNAVYARRLVMRAIRPGMGSLFEVGCAPGAWLAELGRRTGLAVAGCDVAPLGVRAAERNLHLLGVPGRVLEADVFELARRSEERFDLVYSLGVVEHFDDPAEILAAHAALCAPGGRVVVGVPNLEGVSGAIFRRASPTLLRSHRVLSPADLLAAARRAGLEPEASGYGGPLAAFVWLDRVKGRVSHLAGYAFAVALAALTYPGRGRRLSGTVYLVARKP